VPPSSISSLRGARRSEERGELCVCNPLGRSALRCLWSLGRPVVVQSLDGNDDGFHRNAFHNPGLQIAPEGFLDAVLAESGQQFGHRLRSADKLDRCLRPQSR